MSPRLRRSLTWLALLGLSVGLCLIYYNWIWRAPEGSFEWARGDDTYQLLQPRALATVLLLPVFLWVLAGSLADLPWPQRALSLLFRMAFVTLLGLSLAQLVKSAETRDVCTVFAVDVSDSVQDAALDEARKEIVNFIASKKPDDLVKVLTFAERPRLVELTHDEEGNWSLPPPAKLRHFEKTTKLGKGSDLQAALQLSYGLFPPSYLKRVVLFSDGLETNGDVLAEANRASRFKVKLFTRPFRQPPPAEVALRALNLPPKVDIGQTFDIVADVYASRKTQARARLFQGETLNGLDGVKKLDLSPGTNEVRFKSVVRVGGQVTYKLLLDEIERDTFPLNNQFTATLDVPGRPTVLYVEGQPARASYLTSALSAQQFDVDVRAPSAFPASIGEMERYDFVILSDVAKENVSLSAEQLIETYVRDLGGGFLFAGGEAGYGLGGWAHTTLERILPVRMDAERRKEIPGVAMVLVIDHSGSMTGLPIEMAKAACNATVGTLQGDDWIEIIAFDEQPTRYVKMQPARYRSRIQNEVDRIQPGGGTEIFSSLDMAYQDISVVQARKKHVILLTDGQASPEGIRDLVQAMIAESITVTTVGLGTSADVGLLQMIAETGGGRYHYVPDPNSLPRIFTRETELVSRQAAVQEWFPVQQVASADFLRGIAVASAPLLHGYVATQMKGPPAQLILASDRGEPILARWRVGLGFTLAWTSDVKNLWAVDWLSWHSFSKFWGQLVREHMRSKRRREIPMKTEVIDGRIVAVVDAFTADERFDNTLTSTLSVVGPLPGGTRREVPMSQTAPGRYEASLQLSGYGSFQVEAQHRRERNDGSLATVAQSYGSVNNPYPKEYASFEPDIEKLERLALSGGGQIDPPAAAVFDPKGEKIVFLKPLWDRFVLAAIVAFLLDLLVRRIRIFDRKFLPSRAARKAGRGSA